ncbi:MAG: bifunctional phosphoribosyl-AMP cyclohydrolase/phosphoribosyl-ATP diphosphatase HisIE [Lysobacterales bacterium]
MTDDASTRVEPTFAIDTESLAWTKQDGLLPAVVQHAQSLRVLMLGYMDRAALDATLATGRVTFFSRSRQRRWIKGETSGNTLELVGIEADCDSDSLLIQALPRGPTCHLGTASCFPAAPHHFLAELDALIATRVCERPTGSYTTRLLDAGIARIAQKVGEEGVEVALAAVMATNPPSANDPMLGEAGDLVYHLLVLLHARGHSLADLSATLAARHDDAGM